VTRISSSLRIECSAVTITPGFQMTPLDGSLGWPCTLTTYLLARSTTAANSSESVTSELLIEFS
jgi:hypothetical protein